MEFPFGRHGLVAGFVEIAVVSLSKLKLTSMRFEGRTLVLLFEDLRRVLLVVYFQIV